MMKSQNFLTACLLGAIFSTAHSQSAEIKVTNPSNISRPKEPVIVLWSQLPNNGGLQGKPLKLTDEKGMSVPFQIDDLNQDGTQDELTFQSDFLPKQQRSFSLTISSSGELWKNHPHTDAANWKKIDTVYRSIDDDDGPGLLRSQSSYRFDGVGWESELVGYRVYLDERNSVDIQGKRKPGLQWNYIGASSVDYQQDSYWGMDVLHVGPALGVGGIALWAGDSAVKPYLLDRRRCRIIARGPVRAVVRVDYFGWKLGTGRVDLTSLFTIYSGDRATEHQVFLSPGASSRTLATGIVKHAKAKATWDGQQSRLSTFGPQSRANDELLMSLHFNRNDVLKKTEDAINHLVLLRLESNSSIRFVISSRWKGEKDVSWSDKDLEDFDMSIWRRLHEPLNIRVQ